MSQKKALPDKRAFSRRHFLVTAAAGAGVSGASVLASPLGAATKVEATAGQRVHPLLIRNGHNALIHVVVEVREPDVRATSLTFSLRGTDELGDIENLRLFYSGDKRPPELDKARNWKVRFRRQKGIVVRVNGRAIWPGGQAGRRADVSRRSSLRSGTNVFWLSCKLRPTADLSHKVGARCTAIKTSAGMVAPRDATPGVRKRIGVALRRHYDDGVDTYRIPALATTPKGTLLCVYDVRRRQRRDLQEDIDIGLSRSTDGGRSWEPMR